MSVLVNRLLIGLEGGSVGLQLGLVCCYCAGVAGLLILMELLAVSLDGAPLLVSRLTSAL